MSLVVPEAHQQFQHILRLLNTNVDGKLENHERLDRDQGCGLPILQPGLQKGGCGSRQAVHEIAYASTCVAARAARRCVVCNNAANRCAERNLPSRPNHHVSAGVRDSMRTGVGAAPESSAVSGCGATARAGWSRTWRPRPRLRGRVHVCGDGVQCRNIPTRARTQGAGARDSAHGCGRRSSASSQPYSAPRVLESTRGCGAHHGLLSRRSRLPEGVRLGGETPVEVGSERGEARDETERRKLTSVNARRETRGLHVRGQHTKTTGRCGKTVGVSKKRG
ncbi:hypothetical protein C8J57DRAFT_1536748 [Mycena rebaudengoi]|nr:hypothetical protein C8J57DRAFT_1536748 [Mycena rebaudengoi]